MEKKLDVPYRSQRDSDALWSPSDCGAACVAMVLDAFGIHKTIDEIFKMTGQPQTNFLSRTDLLLAAGKFHVTLKKFDHGDHAFLNQAVDDGKPFIALVNYHAWSKNNSGVPTQSSFDKTHFVVVTGYDGNKVFLNDPLWWGSRREEGHHKEMTYNQFASAWGSCHEYQNNPDFVGLITDKAVPDVNAPQPNPVSQKEINRIMAWSAFMGLVVDESTLTNRQVADVYLDFVGPWGSKVVQHTVQQGDDLGLIALRYYADPLKWKVIVYYNDLPPIDAIKVGEVLRIPEPINPI